MKGLFVLLLIIVSISKTYAQPAIDWEKSLGGSDYDYLESIQETSDGGYIAGGYSTSTNGDITGSHGNNSTDYWVVKLSSTGVLQWEKSLGGSNYDYLGSIQETSDGGYIIGGYSSSTDGDITGHHGNGSTDYWVVKLSSTGVLQWEKSLGGTDYDNHESIQETSDGGYIVAGSSSSSDGDVTGPHGLSDYWVVKLSSTGVLQWEKSLGGSDYDYLESIQETSDGGYIVGGLSYSTDGNVTGHYGTTNSSDYWVVKLSSTGVLQWEKSLGGSNDDYLESIQETSDGGYIVGGHSTSTNGDITGHHGLSDYWVVKLNSTGVLQWEKSLGGTDHDYLESIQETSDGGYIIAGSSNSSDGDVTGHHGSSDYWVVKLNSVGILQWEKSLGGSDYDYAKAIQETSDGGYIVAGSSNSSDGNVTGHYGTTNKSDYWVVKLNSTGVLQWEKSLGGSDYDYAKAIQETSNGGYIIAGTSHSADGDVTGHHGTASNEDYWIVKLSSVVSVKNIENTIESIQVYPNPTEGLVHLDLGDLTNVDLTIFNAIGQVIEEKRGINQSQYIIELNAAAGVYWIELKAAGKRAIYKLIKQ